MEVKRDVPLGGNTLGQSSLGEEGNLEKKRKI